VKREKLKPAGSVGLDRTRLRRAKVQSFFGLSFVFWVQWLIDFADCSEV